MTNNSDGLTPTLRSQLGVGWNRALPAPFGFDNCFQGDGSNDFFTVPNLLGKSFPYEFCIEWWMIAHNYYGADYITFKDTVSNKSVHVGGFNSSIETGYSGYTGANSIVEGNKYFLNINYGSITDIYINNVIRDSSSNTSYGPSLVFNLVKLFPIASKFDEFKIYKRKLTKSEISSNYNNGVGNNPSETENILLWYKFQEFEMLDFSPAQDGSDIQLGIRDYSGNNNHALPQNMITDPSDPNYVLKPF